MTTTALTWAFVLQGLITLGLAILLFSLARQIGILHERIAPMGAMVNDRGPEVGEMAPDMRPNLWGGGQFAVGGLSTSGKQRLLFFVSPTCPVCKKLLPIVKSFVGGEKLDVLLIGDGDHAAQERMREQNALSTIPYVSSPEIGMAFKVGKLPYAVLIDEEGVIRAKGLVNSREHLESLVIAKEAGYGTIQAYLKSRGYIAESAQNEGVTVQ
jgi:methylamine dehydrogenase accessory protein MauD